MAAYFLSDIHLKPYNDSRMSKLVSFLDQLGAGTDSVFFLGDIFDFWMGGHKIWIDRYKPLIEAVERLRSRGVEIYFFEGNHDIHIHPFWEVHLQTHIFTEPTVIELYGLKIRIEHGDYFNPDDNAYLFLRRFLRSGFLEWASVNAPGKLVAAIADWGSQTSGKRTKREGRKPEVVQDIKRRTKEYVMKCAQTGTFDIMIMGHTHVREDYEFEFKGKKHRFINLGSWFEPEIQVLVLKPGSIQYQSVT